MMPSVVGSHTHVLLDTASTKDMLANRCQDWLDERGEADGALKPFRDAVLGKSIVVFVLMV